MSKTAINILSKTSSVITFAMLFVRLQGGFVQHFHGGLIHDFRSQYIQTCIVTLALTVQNEINKLLLVNV